MNAHSSGCQGTKEKESIKRVLEVVPQKGRDKEKEMHSCGTTPKEKDAS